MKLVECEEIRTDWFGAKFTFTKDTDGQPIELKERKPLIGSTSLKAENK